MINIMEKHTERLIELLYKETQENTEVDVTTSFIYECHMFYLPFMTCFADYIGPIMQMPVTSAIRET